MSFPSLIGGGWDIGLKLNKMAQRRMFDRDIVSSDTFTEMSSDAQNLYFHLGIHADDEGFVSPKGIMRMISSSEDSIKILIAKGFVIPFESGVVVITDWKQNNYLDLRRVKSTKFTKEKEMLTERNRQYSLLDGMQSACKMPKEDRIGQDRIVNNIAAKDAAASRVFVLEDKLLEMEAKPGSYLDVIATFIREKELPIENSAQLSAVIGRHCRVAKKLEAYSIERIHSAIDQICKDNKKREDPINWTVDTILKYVTK